MKTDRSSGAGPMTRWLLGLGGALAGLVFCELLLRLAGPSLPVSFTSRSLQESHSVYGVFHRPGASAWTRDPEYTTFVRFNGDGLRGPGIASRPSAGQQRVLVVGDSFVEGAEVDEAEALPEALGRRLAAPDRPVEALNAGVRGWGTAQQYLYLVNQGLALQPDTVVLVLYVGNDLVDNSLELSTTDPDNAPRRPFFTLQQGRLALTPAAQPPGSPLAPLLEILRTRSAVYNLAENGVVAKLGTADQAEVLRSVHRLAFAAPPAAPWERSWAVTEALLVAARDASEQRGARFLLAVAPHKGQLDAGDWASLVRGSPPPNKATWDQTLPQRRLARLAAQQGIDSVDLLPALRAAGGTEPLYFAENSHWTAVGHRVVAEAIARHLLEGSDRTKRAAP